MHDAEQEHLRNKTFPNYALMKISAYHKSRGDMVEWWIPMKQYDRVYSSKVFDFTPENPYLPECTIRGGTGYPDIPINKELPRKLMLCFLITVYTRNVITQSDISQEVARIIADGVLCRARKDRFEHTGIGKNLCARIVKSWY
ncbi:hypothetical protein D7X25_07365 [bacterium 1XD42-8]|nr:hypothetical protein D7X25_07365 [bacterium 1XD42-8]